MEQSLEFNNEIRSAADDQFSFKDYMDQCLAKWKWFVASVVVICCIGMLYILRQQPEYSRSMQVLIKDQDMGGGADISSAFSSMGLVASNTNVNNEMIALLSPAVMYEVAQRLNLDVNYVEKGTFHGTTLYGKTAPYIVNFPDLKTEQGGSFRITIRPDGSALMERFAIGTAEGVEKFDTQIELKPGFQAVKTPLGKVTFTPNPVYTGGKLEEPLIMYVGRSGMQSTVENYLSKVKGDLTDKDADVIDLSIRDVSIERAVDVLNNIVAVYNEIWVNDKNQIAVATSSFIDERLKLLQSELGVVDSDISEYKSRTLVPDIQEAAKLNMKSTQDLSDKELELNNQLSMATYVRDYLQNPANRNAVIPVNTGMGSNQLEVQITTYNNILLARNNLAASSSANNPLVRDYDTQLVGMREAIDRAVNAQVVALNKNLRNLGGAKGELREQLSSAPSQAKHLLGIERQQKVKEELYLFLLQKREENELSQTFTAYNTRIITPPYGSLRPVAPKTMLIMLIAFLAGLAIPAMIIYIRESTNTKIRSRKDIERMTTPFVGEIPFVGRKRFMSRFRKKTAVKKKGQLEEVKLAVRPGSRDVASEAFKVIRGNIDFMIKNDENSNVIMLTSFNPGSGKSYISFNLAASFVMKGKKVLVIDCDLRHGSTSQFVGMPSQGLSNYLIGTTDNWRSMLRPGKDLDGLAVMPIGHRPPNPSELLDNGRLGELLKEATREYDYVFLDCPPVDIVVDTQIIEKYVDRTIFVIRAGLLEKDAVPEIDMLYKHKRFKQMCILLNGTEGISSRYGYYNGSGYYNYHHDLDD